ncbi:MAG: PrsW family glutamic-type intramembrane protease [Bacteroidales bacterium]|nr:PrsW family intramembrane metalloprotease [Bacteroidales bacterium]MDD4603713.1 PrsW family glutamic-type intramembrane protease [Bacteroidales bacterium]
MLVKIAVSLIPVFLLLILLLYLDSMKLVNMQLLLLCLMWGVVSAGLSFFCNTYLIYLLGFTFDHYSGFVAPFIEELLKLSFLWILIRKNKIGFMIDGAIYGFSIGAVFSFCENLFYLFSYAGDEGNLMVWITRGFGTAVMHCGTTAIFGILCMSALNRRSNLAMATTTGALAAILIHGIFNQFLLSPLISTVLVLVIVPISIVLIFQENEKTIRNWLELEFDSEVAILRMIKKGRFSETKTGEFLLSVKHHFPKEEVFDMYCFISLYLELSLKAKSHLMLKENDLVLPPDPEIPAKLKELKALERSIGRAGYLAIVPVLRMNRKDLWKISLLK